MLELLAHVAQTGAEAAHEAGAEHHVEATALGISLLTPGFFVALSMLCVFAILLWKRVPALIAKALDERIAGIKTQLDEAASLRAEAQKLRDEYAAKAKQADKDIAAIREQAEKQAADIVEQAKADAGALIERHKALSADKIAAAERAAIEELRAKAAAAATAAARELIGKELDEAADKKLVDKAIADI
jgi:F-type H+-transporting ATPase subunit b